jgi:hypothetical protein
MNEPKSLEEAEAMQKSKERDEKGFPQQLAKALAPRQTLHPLFGMVIARLDGTERQFTLSEKAKRKRDLQKKSEKNYVSPAAHRKMVKRWNKKAALAAAKKGKS